MNLMRLFSSRKNTETEQDIWIISGPSSCGKSSFIMHERSNEITGLASNSPTILAGAFGKKKVNTGSYLHYNILWPAYRNLDPYDFDSEKTWKRILKSRQNFKAIVLKASLDVIIERIKRRDIVEKSELSSKAEKKYKNNKWLMIYEKIDLDQLYQNWINQLKRHKIPYIVIDANRIEYTIIENNMNLQ
jgi:hypothetical protein